MDLVLKTITVLCFIYLTDSVDVFPCTGIAPAVEVDIAFCDELPCPLIKGTTASVNMTFLVPYDMDTGTFEIKAKLGPITVPFPPPDKNICHGLINAYCPLDQGEIVTHHFALPVLSFYPTGISMTLKLTFKDEDGNPIMCFQVPCKVTAQK